MPDDHENVEKYIAGLEAAASSTGPSGGMDAPPEIRYRVIERIGADASEWTWTETDRGTFTAMPGHYTEPTMADAEAYAAKFNREDREIQFWTRPRRLPIL